MVDGSYHGVRRTKEGPGLKDHNGVETLMHRAWVTHHHCPLALEQSVKGGAGINVNQKPPERSNMWLGFFRVLGQFGHGWSFAHK